MNDKHYTLNDGMPTGPDVALLQKHWANPKPGDKMTYAEIEQILGISRSAPRFIHITNAWRKRERQAGIVIECERKQGFYVATPEQITGMTYAVVDGIARKARNHRKKLHTTQCPAHAPIQQHQMRLLLAIENDMKKTKMNILPNTQAPEPVRILPPSPQ